MFNCMVITEWTNSVAGCFNPLINRLFIVETGICSPVPFALTLSLSIGRLAQISAFATEWLVLELVPRSQGFGSETHILWKSALNPI